MKNRQFIVLCMLMIIGFGYLGYKQYKTDTRVDYVNDRLSFRADKVIELQKDQEFTAEIVGEHSKDLRGKKAR